MRVLAVGTMYPPESLGGYEALWRDVTGHLRGRGHEVRVLATDYRNPGRDPAAPDDPDVRRELRWYWRDHGFPRIGWRARIALERHNASVLERHVADLEPDVVCWWALGGLSVGLVERVRRAGLPAVGVVGDDWMAYAPRFDAWHHGTRRAPALAERLTGLPASVDLGGAAHWICISETVRARALRAAGALPRAQVAHPGVDPARFAPVAPAAWRGELLYCGRIDPRKGIGTAVEALVELDGARLTIDGGGDEAHATELRALAARLGVAERVVFTVSDPADVPAAYARADAVVFPVTWREPWGLVPLEAMAVGRPVIATGRGGSGEYLRDEENCLIFAAGDAAALAAAVDRLAGDEVLRERLRADGAATAARFPAQAFSDAVERALEAAAARRR